MEGLESVTKHQTKRMARISLGYLLRMYYEKTIFLHRGEEVEEVVELLINLK